MTEEKSIQERYAPRSTCFGCGPRNEAALGVRFRLEGDGLRYEVTVTGTSNLGDFMSGTISTEGFSEKVLSVSASSIRFRADKKSFKPGKGRLFQDPMHPALWMKVAEFPATNLPVELAFSDPLRDDVPAALGTAQAGEAVAGRPVG